MTYTQNDKLLFTMYLVLFETKQRTKTVEKLTKLIGSYFHKPGTYPKVYTVGLSRNGNHMKRRDIVDKPEYAEMKTEVASMWRKHTSKPLSLGALLIALESYADGRRTYSQKLMEKAHTSYYFNIEKKAPEERALLEAESEKAADALLLELGYTLRTELGLRKKIVEQNRILEGN